MITDVATAWTEVRRASGPVRGGELRARGVGNAGEQSRRKGLSIV